MPIPKPHTCSGCPLHRSPGGFSTLEGTGKNGVLIVGEALEPDARGEGLPLRPYGQAGSILQRTINGLGLQRDDFGITTIVRCAPPNNLLDKASYELEAIENCNQYLIAAVEHFKPKVIFALGNIPLRTLTGLSGKKKSIMSLRGYVLSSPQFNLPVVASYHPAFLARGKKNLIGVFSRDLSKAIFIAKGDYKEFSHYHLNPQQTYGAEYNLSASTMDINAAVSFLRRNPEIPFAYDIETPWSLKEEDETDVEDSHELNIDQFQVSWRKGQAIVLDRVRLGNATFLAAIGMFMSLPNLKLDWNGWMFDIPKLKAAGVDITPSSGVESLDLMTMWRYFQPDVPSGLQYVASIFNFPFPWKHLSGEDLAFYGACDTDAIMYIYEPLKQLMQKEGIW